MKTKLTLIFTVTFLFILLPIYGQWPKHVIDVSINLAVSVDVADMDGDTKSDLVVTNLNGYQIIMYQNNFPQWTKHIIDNVGSTFAYTGDMDNNDTLDVVACLWPEEKMVWYKNKHPIWTKHMIDENPDNADFMLVADFDNDDTLDVVTAGGYGLGGDVVWYENNHPDWTKHIIESGSSEYPSLNVNDIDGDGLLDVVATMNAVGRVVWFKNENKGTTWTKYTIDDNINGAWGINSYDIDGDDTIDVVATSQTLNDVVWYENHHQTWTKHVIDTNLYGANWVGVTDVDGNDTMDVIAVGLNADDVVWYKNNHPEWTKHIIDANLDAPRVFAVSDVDEDEINDLIVPAGGSIVWHKNPYTTVAFAESMEFGPFYIQTPDDTLKIVASLSNPEDHQVTLSVVIQGDQFAYLDSLQLFDDGLHSDGDSANNIWGNIKLATGLPEDVYTVDLVTQDLTSGNTHYYHQPARFINFGPVAYEGYAFDASDTEPNPGDRVKLELTLRNNGTVATATKITAELISLDPLVSVLTGSKPYDDIPAGENSTPETYTINISEECPGNKEVPIVVNISSYDNICWSDTFSILVQEPTGIKDIQEQITRIYPNPTDNILNIEITNSDTKGLEIEILDITGKVIYQRESENPSSQLTEQLDLSGYAKGIYLIRVRQADAVYIRKVIVK